MNDSFETNTKKVFKKLVSEISQDQLVFMWTTSDCKPQNGHKSIDNPTKVMHTKSLKKVWEMYTQYDATNIVIVDCSLERVKKNPEENVILATPYIPKNQESSWLINELWRILSKINKERDVRATLKDFR